MLMGTNLYPAPKGRLQSSPGLRPGLRGKREKEPSASQGSRGCPTVDFAASQSRLAASPWERGRPARNMRINPTESRLYLTPGKCRSRESSFAAASGGRDARAPRAQPVDSLSRPGLCCIAPAGLWIRHALGGGQGWLHRGLLIRVSPRYAGQAKAMPFWRG